MRFSGKVCLVTGGGSGIGRATCERFAADGGRVAIVDINEDKARETARMIAAAGGQAIYVKADVAVSADVKAAVERVIEDWGRLDILVNNAAMMTFSRVVDLSEDEWDRVLAVNLRSVFLFCKYSLPLMKEGVIINTSSVHAHETTPDVAPYAASKGGIEAFTRALSREYDPTRIRVNCVAPGGVDTPMLWANPSIRKETIVGPVAQPEDVAAVICFLASDEARFINGTTIVVDGGLLQIL